MQIYAGICKLDTLHIPPRIDTNTFNFYIDSIPFVASIYLDLYVQCLIIYKVNKRLIKCFGHCFSDILLKFQATTSCRNNLHTGCDDPLLGVYVL